MTYTENEINAQLKFFINPSFQKAERFEQKPNRTIAHGTIEELFGEFEETDFFNSFSSSNEKFIESLAIGLGACLNAGLLFFLLRKHGIYRPGKGWAAFLVKMAISLVVMGGGLWLAQSYLPFEWVHVGGFKKAGQLCVLIALGGGLYFVSLAALGFRPHHFRRVEK